MLKYTVLTLLTNSRVSFPKPGRNDESSLDEFVRENTSFDSWHSMQEKAAELWALKRLGL